MSWGEVVPIPTLLLEESTLRTLVSTVKSPLRIVLPDASISKAYLLAEAE